MFSFLFIDVSFIIFFSDFDVQAQFSVNQSRPEEITMTEDLSSITFVGDDGFGKTVTSREPLSTAGSTFLSLPLAGKVIFKIY